MDSPSVRERGHRRHPVPDVCHRLHQHRDRQRQRGVQPVAAVVLARDIELAQEGVIPLGLPREVSAELLPVGARLRCSGRGSRQRSQGPAPAIQPVMDLPVVGTGAVYERSKNRYELGGAKGTRTPDPLVANQVLFQLSYSPARRRYQGTRSARPVRWAAPAARPRSAAARAAASQAQHQGPAQSGFRPGPWRGPGRRSRC